MKCFDCGSEIKSVEKYCEECKGRVYGNRKSSRDIKSKK